MAEHLQEAYRVDIEARTNAEAGQRDIPEGHKVNAHEIGAGVVYKDDNVTVTAFPTKHAVESYGYRFDTSDRSVVISGDTNPTQAMIDACHGCDVLIHDGMPLSSLENFPPVFQAFAGKYHTTTAQLAELAAKATPHLLIVYHVGAGDSGERVSARCSTAILGTLWSAGTWTSTDPRRLALVVSCTSRTTNRISRAIAATSVASRFLMIVARTRPRSGRGLLERSELHSGFGELSGVPTLLPIHALPSSDDLLGSLGVVVKLVIQAAQVAGAEILYPRICPTGNATEWCGRRIH